MAQVTGLGGVFFKSDDPEKLYQWYEKHLGIKREPHGQGATFNWRDTQGGEGVTAWAIFPRSTKYFEPSRAPFMLNYIVDDLDGLLAELHKAGVQIDPKREDADYGRFAWIIDPEGNRIELWEPAKSKG